LSVNDDREVEIHTAEPLVSESRPFEVETGIEKMKGYKSLGIDEIAAEFIQAGGQNLRSEIHKLIHSISKKEKLPEQCKDCYCTCL
jgi:hypothetical protein